MLPSLPPLSHLLPLLCAPTLSLLTTPHLSCTNQGCQLTPFCHLIPCPLSQTKGAGKPPPMVHPSTLSPALSPLWCANLHPAPLPSMCNQVNITQTACEHGGGRVHANGEQEDCVGVQRVRVSEWGSVEPQGGAHTQTEIGTWIS